MDIFSALAGGFFTIAGVMVASMFQLKHRRLGRVERLRKETRERCTAKRHERLVALQEAASVMDALRGERGLTALVVSIDARGSGEAFEKRYRKSVDLSDAARVGVLGNSDALPAGFQDVAVAMSCSWGAFRAMFEVSNRLESID